MNLIYFTAPWCKTCKSVKPLVEAVNANTQTVDVSTDDGEKVAMYYDILSLPTVIALDEGNFVGALTGSSITKDSLKMLIEQV